MTIRVRDIPPGVKFCLIRNGHKFTMIGQHEKFRYLYRVLAHEWQCNKAGVIKEQMRTLNGQSYAKPIIRASEWRR